MYICICTLHILYVAKGRNQQNFQAAGTEPRAVS